MFGALERSEPWAKADVEQPEWLAEARAALVKPGDYLAFDDGERVRVIPLGEDWTRIGRGLSAQLRLDDPTVSRRHALIHRDGDSTRILDDRSLNGVFVNGERVEWQELEDGDEIVVGAYRLHFVGLTAGRRRPARVEVAEKIGAAVG